MNHATIYINNQWEAGKDKSFRSVDPATGLTAWEGPAANTGQIDRAVAAARAAQPAWERTSLDQRIALMNAFGEKLKSQKQKLIDAICREIGKPKWETTGEVDAMIGKVPVSIAAYHERRREIVVESAGGIIATRFKPHGVVAVFGPFNFPGHLL